MDFYDLSKEERQELVKKWENKKLVDDALIETMDVYKHYKFVEKSPEEAEEYIKQEFHNYS